MKLPEIKWVAQKLIDSTWIDFLDFSLWDVFKKANETLPQNQLLLEYFANLDLKKVLLTAAGKIRNGKDVHRALNLGVDFVSIGRSGILHYDFPAKVIANANFSPIVPPVSKDYLGQQGLGMHFINYLLEWTDFVVPD